MKEKIPPQQIQKTSQLLFDRVMAGDDQASQAYIDNIELIYNGYLRYANDFGENAQPIMDALTADIKEMQNYVTDYENIMNNLVGSGVGDDKTDNPDSRADITQCLNDFMQLSISPTIH
ncbi:MULTISPECIES: hypothetical protein [Methylomonas]|uniref:Uncharacterized protein n=2 Tax=Methylomonas TaxID=416 RepID=A0A140E680_9GAMM|nr:MULTISPECIES: hypothetical protein [Methylomonas]AMK78904.1 hypothetical protein JT25_020855 [Methylomonas denitrificans]OAI02175.1 hypothetical protein A1342_02785 [Methylomonas methanica]TCV78232.1 hypothetical protein EDE11_1246 [Methylomonas methanica]